MSTIYDKFNLLYTSPHKQKRGLINGLGSIIKTITGNLDYNDALEYNRAISTLQKNQDNIIEHLNSGLTLNKNILETYNLTLSTLVTNEIKIKYKLDEIISSVNMTNYHLTDYIKVNSLYILIKVNLDKILLHLTLLENSIAFSKVGIIHHSVINTKDIQYISNILLSLYEKQELLINEVTDLRDYYDLVKCGSYYVDNTVVFVLKFPIMYKNTFTYYHLFPTPTYNNSLLIPPKPYLAMNEDSHQYMETECPKYHDKYHCDDAALTVSSRDDDCTYLLLLKQEISSSCQYLQFKSNLEILLKIDDVHYLLSNPNSTKIKLLCKEESYQVIKDTYLLEVPEGCSFSTNQHTVKNYQNVLRGHPIKLLSFMETNISVSNPGQPLKLENVPLDQLYKLSALIEKENYIKPVYESKESHHLWTAPLYVFLILIGIYVLYKKIRQTHNFKVNEKTQDIEMNIMPSTSEDKPVHKSEKHQPFLFKEKGASN